MSRRKPYEIHESAKAPRTWRSLEEKDADPQVLREQAEAERPGGFLDVRSVTSRRSFMKVSALTAAAVGVEGCVRRPVENIVPYTQGPEYLQPGVPLHYATVTSRGADALGLVVTTHEGRPTKVDGNIAHPSSAGGASDIAAQLSVLDVYDSDRLRTPSKKSGDSRADKTIEEFDAAFAALVEEHVAQNGAGLRFLVQPTNSPTFIRLRQQVLSRLPLAKFHTYSSVNDSNILEGARLAFGRPLRVVSRLETAKVILALDCDFLGEETGSVRNGRAFGSTRRVDGPESSMSRLYAVEAGHSVTGASADHRLRLPGSRIEAYLKALGRKIGTLGVDLSALSAVLTGDAPVEDTAHWIDAVAADLVANRGANAILVGRRQPARVHALALAINHALGNFGQTMSTVPSVDDESGDEVASLKALVADAANVKTLVLFGGNPIYDAPSDVDVAGLLRRSGVTSVHLTSIPNETSELCTWACPEAHELETWGDQRAIDGTMAIQQPMMESLWYTRAAIELLAVAAHVRNWRAAYLVRETQRSLTSMPALFERDFRRMLHAGVVPSSTYAPMTDVVPNAAGIVAALTPAALPAIGENAFELQFVACPKLYDGRFANNLWALELPDPMTKLVWDNAALVSKATRNALQARDGDMVRITANGKSVELPIYALAGVADHCVTLALGWGRTAAGRHGNGKGFDVQPLRSSTAFHFVNGARVEKLSSHYDLVATQEHDRMEGRAIAIDATLAEYREEPDFASYRTVEFNNGPLWTETNYERGHKWGMVVDLSGCFGCNACVVACQAENNIPTVGKREVARGREMFWIRIDRYFIGDSDSDPQVALQPVGCQHCEEAPCENVCPVNATAHSPEGLNDMAYNRCIGTRYCANNCPYKVRRFNYLDWHTQEEEFEQATQNVNHLFAPPHTFRTYGQFDRQKQMQFNPNVTVRMRGVIEKCSYCVQRIQEAKIAARRESRAIGANEIVTACQAACASGCITFGDLNNPESRAAQLAQRDRRYKLLAEVGAQPRTTFLAKIRNPNPAMGGESHAGAEGAH